MSVHINTLEKVSPEILSTGSYITNDSSKISEIKRKEFNISIWQRNLN